MKTNIFLCDYEENDAGGSMLHVGLQHLSQVHAVWKQRHSSTHAPMLSHHLLLSTRS